MIHSDGLGREYADGDMICRQGELGDCMYVIQAGRVRVVQEVDDKEVPLAELKTGEIFGEMAIVERKPRSASVRAIGRARVLRIDKRMFLRGVHEDPSLAYRILQKMSERVRRVSDELAHLKKSSVQAHVARPVQQRYVIVITLHRPEVYARLRERFGDDGQADVHLDRRRAERRQEVLAHQPERRRADRRQRAEGWTIHLAADASGTSRCVVGAGPVLTRLGEEWLE